MAQHYRNVRVVTDMWPGAQPAFKTTLRIDFDTLADILYQENAILAETDVPALLGTLHAYAVQADNGSDETALEEWDERVELLEEAEEDASEEDED